MIALGKRKSQTRAAERLGAVAAFDISEIENPVRLVREMSDGCRGADAVIEAVGTATTWQWAVQMARKGGTVNLFGGCPRGSHVEFDPAALHYSEITIKSTFHHTPQFMREALETIARGEVRASDFITGEVPLADLPARVRAHEAPQRPVEDCYHPRRFCAPPRPSFYPQALWLIRTWL